MFTAEPGGLSPDGEGGPSSSPSRFRHLNSSVCGRRSRRASPARALLWHRWVCDGQGSRSCRAAVPAGAASSVGSLCTESTRSALPPPAQAKPATAGGVRSTALHLLKDFVPFPAAGTKDLQRGRYEPREHANAGLRFPLPKARQERDTTFFFPCITRICALQSPNYRLPLPGVLFRALG